MFLRRFGCRWFLSSIGSCLFLSLFDDRVLEAEEEYRLIEDLHDLGYLLPCPLRVLLALIGLPQKMDSALDGAEDIEVASKESASCPE